MNHETIKALESAALVFAAAHANPHGSMQEHAAKCAMASALLITAALELSEDATAD